MIRARAETGRSVCTGDIPIWYSHTITLAIDSAPPLDDPSEVLLRLSAALPELSPQLARAAEYLLDNPAEVAVSTTREIADAADVTPNTVVRLARAVGFEGFDDLREPFRRQVADATLSFPDRARFLQSINQGGQHGNLLADMAAAALANVESLFAAVDMEELKAAGDLVAGARVANILGVGTAQPLADNFAYVAGMALDHVRSIPGTGLSIDHAARFDQDDVLLAMTFSPYRIEIVKAVEMAHTRGVPVIALSDSLAAPILRGAIHRFVVPNDSPLPFSSNVAATALLETLLAFVVAHAEVDVVTAIDTFHANRRSAGIYTD